MKKRILAISVAFMLILSAMAGCSSSKTSSSSYSSSSSTSPITIKIGMWPADTDATSVAMFKSYVKTFNEKYPNVKVEADHYDYAVDTFVSMAQAGTLPNVFETWYTEPQKLIKNKFVADITSELKAKGWDKDMNSNILNIVSSDSKIYGIPRDAYALGLMLNMSLFKQAGLLNKDGTAQYPKTWTELATTAQTIKAKTGKAGFCLLAKDGSGGWHFSNIAWDFGATLEVKDGTKYKANLNSKEAIAAMQYVKDLKWKYNVLTDDPTSVDWSGGFQQLGTGNAAMLIAAQDAVMQPTTTNGLPVSDLSMVPIPAGDGGQYSLMGGTPYMFSSNSTPEQITACLNFIEIMGKAPVVTADSISGLEKDAANKVKDGTPVIPTFPAWTNKDYLAAQQKAIDDNPNVNMALFNDYFSFVKKDNATKTEEPDDTQDLYSTLTKVLQAVVTDKNADVTKLMTTANSNFQKVLDADK
jgi:multiple sugar transport system substrate-binding protein